jgi:hypothetical protein
MQKMLYIFRGKRSYGKVFRAFQLFFSAGNTCQDWLSGHSSENNQSNNFFTIKSFFRRLYAIISSRIFFARNGDQISKTTDQSGITMK